jgi:hypothetical protein
MVDRIYDNEENLQTTQTVILRTFATFMKAKYAIKITEDNAIQDILQTRKTRIPPEAHQDLEQPITMDELRTAVQQGKQKNAAGIDGICHDLFQKTWETIKSGPLTIMNTMSMNGEVFGSQKHGVIVCIPKIKDPNRPSDFRPLTLLNADFKLLSCVIANRMRQWINVLLHPSQYCGAHDNNIYGAITTIRETIANGELTTTPICILTLDFKDAFDNIAHTNLFTILEAYWFSKNFRD